MDKIDTSIFKAYDIRGIYPEQINAELVYRIAQAYVEFFTTSLLSSPSLGRKPKRIAIGCDMRLSGEELKEAVIRGLTDSGVDVIDIGLVSTDTLYFAAATLDVDGGIQITASHNPKEYGGMKMVREKGHPISGDTGIYQIRDMVKSDLRFKTLDLKGSVEKKDVTEDYINHVLSVIDLSKIKPLKVVANPNFGMANLAIERLKSRLPVEFVEVLNDHLDGNFPKGRPDPLVPSNREEIIAAIKNQKPNLGVSWDADADRCFFYDENGRFLPGYYTNAVLARYFLQKYPHSKIVTDLKLNWAVKDLADEVGGEALIERTGHSFFKQKMISEDAVFGGEVSGHYYFKDNFYLDNGIIPFLVILEIMSTSNKKLSEIYQPYFEKYFVIEETNLQVSDVGKVLAAVKEKYSTGQLSELDGVSLEFPEWRVNIRASNTEPLLRINMEAKSQAVLDEKSKEVVEFIGSIK
jgi:phosphomannomutase